MPPAVLLGRQPPQRNIARIDEVSSACEASDVERFTAIGRACSSSACKGLLFVRLLTEAACRGCSEHLHAQDLHEVRRA